MHLTGTSLARWYGMNDRVSVPTPSALALLQTADVVPSNDDDAARRDADSEDLDKYDVSTLACTD